MEIHNFINELADLCGIVPEYYDVWGNHHSVSFKTKVAILNAMGYDTESEESVKYFIERVKNRKFLRLIEPVMVVSIQDSLKGFRIYIPLNKVDIEGASIAWHLSDEEGHREVKRMGIGEIPYVGEIEVQGKKIGEFSLPFINNKTPGYYLLRVEISSRKGILKDEMRLIITPRRCYIPPQLEGNAKTWGLAVNLYAICSERNQGIGDLTDLEKIVEWVGRELKGDFVAINPLHSITNKTPYGISPYSPISRLYSNLVYLDLQKIEDVKNSKRAISIMQAPEFIEKIKRVREAKLIDYETVAELKRTVIDAAFQTFYEKHFFRMTRHARRFREFIRSEGRALENYAIFMTLYEHFRNEGLYHWKDWPEEYRSPYSEKVKDLIKEHKEKVLFHQYIQWLIEEQLKIVSLKAGESGMSIGLYRDLAIGSLSEGSDVWGNQGIFALHTSTGAPPDEFSPKGQNWGIPPLIPERLREEGYEFFIQLVRKNLRHAGAIRIDHALGLFRLFWIPEGMRPEEGAYVKYPHEDILKIIALESVKNRTLVIAEDLGTIGEGVREALHSSGMFSFRLFYFERDQSTFEFLPPDAYPEMAITSATTHDLPTLSGFWKGEDIEIKKRLNLHPDEEFYQKEINNRAKERERVLRALKGTGLLPQEIQEEIVTTEQLCLAIYKYLGLAPSKLLIVNLDDLLNILTQQNLPGTTSEYPNWRQKIPYNIEEVMKIEIFKSLRNIRII